MKKKSALNPWYLFLYIKKNKIYYKVKSCINRWYFHRSAELKVSLIKKDRYFYKNNEMIQIKTMGAINKRCIRKPWTEKFYHWV